MDSTSVLGVTHLKAPSPNARVFGGAGVAWSGGEGERVPDPVTPDVEWLGGTRGGTRCAGVVHEPAGPSNGGDVAVASRNLRLRDASLADCEVTCEVSISRRS